MEFGEGTSVPPLKAYRFLWNNRLAAIEGKDGTTYCPPQKAVVIAASEAEARILFQKGMEDRRARMRERMKGGPDGKHDEMLNTIFNKDDVHVQEFEIKEGLIV